MFSSLYARPIVVLLISFFLSWFGALAKPISIVGLEAWLNHPTTCKDACESQWWTLEPAQFGSAEECTVVVCTPIEAFALITGRSSTEQASPDLPMALLEDFLLNCDAMCDAEWWFDNTGLESATHCRRAICTHASAPAPYLEEKEEQVVINAATVSVTSARKIGNATAPAPAPAPATATAGSTLAFPNVGAPQPHIAIVPSSKQGAASTLPVAAATDLSHMVRPKKGNSKKPAAPAPSSSSSASVSSTTQTQVAAPSSSAAALSPSQPHKQHQQHQLTAADATAALLAASPESLLPQGPCYKHSTCTEAGYCAADLKCHSIMACKHGAADNAIRPIDNQCPPIDPEAAAAATAAAAAAAIPVSIAKVQVYVGHFVDQIRFVLSNGKTVKFGPEGGAMQEEYTVPVGEWITWIKVRQGEHLDSIQFYTNRGKSSPFYGGQGGRKAIYHVKRGNEVLGLTRSSDANTVSPPVAGIEEQLHRTLLVTHGVNNGNGIMNPNSMQVLR